MVKVGLIGAGYWGSRWLKALKQLQSQVTLAGVYDPGASTELKSAAELAAKADALLIASPTHTHLEYLRIAAEAGKAALCASPLQADDAGLSEIAALAQSAKAPILASLPLRSRDELKHLKHAADEQRLGTIGMVRLSLCRSTASRGSDWYDDPGKSGGAMVDVGAHAIDTIRWAFGEFDHIQALQSEVSGTPDYALATGRLVKGPIVHLECSWCEHDGGGYMYYEVAGSAGLMEYDSRKEPLLSLQPRTERGTKSEFASPEVVKDLEAFLAAVSGKGKYTATLEDALIATRAAAGAAKGSAAFTAA